MAMLAPDERKALIKAYAEQFGDDLRARFSANAIGVGRASGTDGRPGDVALILYFDRDQLESMRTRVPDALTWEREGLPPIEIPTSVQPARVPKFTRRLK
jgi:hypothetical protein